jgi:hypothetical protein
MYVTLYNVPTSSGPLKSNLVVFGFGARSRFESLSLKEKYFAKRNFPLLVPLPSKLCTDGFYKNGGMKNPSYIMNKRTKNICTEE